MSTNRPITHGADYERDEDKDDEEECFQAWTSPQRPRQRPPQRPPPDDRLMRRGLSDSRGYMSTSESTKEEWSSDTEPSHKQKTAHRKQKNHVSRGSKPSLTVLFFVPQATCLRRTGPSDRGLLPAPPGQDGSIRASKVVPKRHTAEEEPRAPPGGLFCSMCPAVSRPPGLTTDTLRHSRTGDRILEAFCHFVATLRASILTERRSETVVYCRFYASRGHE
ncbi:unnamed protein product [Gadus morhua 'NCC']